MGYDEHFIKPLTWEDDDHGQIVGATPNGTRFTAIIVSDVFLLLADGVNYGTFEEATDAADELYRKWVGNLFE